MGKQLISTLERLKQQREIINARIQKAESRQKTNARKQDARRKILIGAYYMDRAQKEGTYHELVKRIDPFLTRNSDRKLFGLPEIAETDTPASQDSTSTMKEKKINNLVTAQKVEPDSLSPLPQLET
jgi:hypothetical protein